MDTEKIGYFLQSQYGIRAVSIMPFEGGVMNSNFKVETLNERFVFRIYNHTKTESVFSEVRLLKHLEGKGFPCPCVIASNSQDLVLQFEGKPTVLYRLIEGDLLRDITVDNIHKIGQLMGRMHVDLQDFVYSDKKYNWDPDGIRDLVFNRGDYLKLRGVPDAQEILDFLNQEIPKYTFPKLPMGVTHQDIKPENIISKDGNIVGIIDFDNNYYGTLIHDLTTTLIWTCFNDNGLLDMNCVTNLLSGYNKYRQLTQLENDLFLEAIKWRLLREVFIGPFVTEGHSREIETRYRYFMNLYKKLV